MSKRGSKAVAIEKMKKPLRKFTVCLPNEKEKLIEAHFWDNTNHALRFFSHESGETQLIALFNTWDYVVEIPTKIIGDQSISP